MRVDREARSLVAAAVAQGWSTRIRTRHLWLLSPDGVTTCSVPSSSGDRKSHLNLRASLRRAGVTC